MRLSKLSEFNLSVVHPHEIELLLYCVQAQVSPQPVSVYFEPDLFQIVENLDWAFLLETAQAHGVMPLLYKQLQTEFADFTPSTVLEQLRRTFQANAFTKTALTLELLEVVTFFEAAKIPVLAFKGPMLAELAYGDVGLRQFLDIDLLIPVSELFRAKTLLLKHNYKPNFELNSAQQTIHAKIAYELDFWQPEKDIMLDLHWSVLPKFFSFTPNPALIWANQTNLTLFNKKLPTLAPECLLLYLCAHNAKHNWSGLSMICDMAALLNRQPELDWDWILAHAGEFGSVRMLGVGLWLAHTLLKAPLPEHILKWCERDPQIPKLGKQVCQQLFQPDPGLMARLTWANIYLKSMENWRDKFWYWLDIATTPIPLDLIILPLPVFLFPLYYPLRFIRLIFKFARKLNIKRTPQS